jgi:hypothetical protein
LVGNLESTISIEDLGNKMFCVCQLMFIICVPQKVGGARFNMCSKVESFIFLFAHMRLLMCIDVKVGEPGENEPHHPPLGHTMRDGWWM